MTEKGVSQFIGSLGRRYGTLRSLSAPTLRKTTTRLPLSIVWPSVGHCIPSREFHSLLLVIRTTYLALLCGQWGHEREGCDTRLLECRSPDIGKGNTLGVAEDRGVRLQEGVDLRQVLQDAAAVKQDLDNTEQP